MSLKNKIGICFLIVLSMACQKKGDPEPNKLQSTELEYDSKALILDKKAFESIVEISEDKKTYILAASVFDRTPVEGQTFLIPGKVMRKVVSVAKMGNNLEIETEPAVLTDVIKNGTIAYETTPEWGTEEALLVNGKKARRVNGVNDKIIEYVFKAEGIDYKIGIEPVKTDNGVSSCKFQMQMIKKSAGSPNVSLIGEGTMTLPTQRTNITIKDGSLENFSSDNKGISGTINLSIAAADGEPGETAEVLPNIALSFPIRVLPTPFGLIPNPIPMSIDVGVQFVTSIKFTGSTTSATAKSTVSYNADGGFSFASGKMDAKGNLKQDSIADGKFDAAGFFGSKVDVQFGIAFPRIGLVLADEEVAYIHVGFTTGSRLQWGPLCKTGYTKILLEAGYGLKILGATIFGEKITLAERKKEAKGEGCP